MFRGRDGRTLGRDEAKKDRGGDHGDGEHGAEGHVGSGGVGEADHADGGGKKKQKPARGFGAVQTESEPRCRESGEKRGDGARQAGCGFADAEKFEAQGCAPIVERGLLEPRVTVEAWRDPVAGFGHGASDRGVTGFVWADEADGA